MDGEVSTGRVCAEGCGIGCWAGPARRLVLPLREVPQDDGHVSAYASARRDDLEFIEDHALTWYRSETDETPGVTGGSAASAGPASSGTRGARTSFTSPRGRWIPTGLRAAGHVWLSQAGDYYEITDDLPRAEGSSGGGFLTPERATVVRMIGREQEYGRRVRRARRRPAPAAGGPGRVGQDDARGGGVRPPRPADRPHRRRRPLQRGPPRGVVRSSARPAARVRRGRLRRRAAGARDARGRRPLPQRAQPAAGGGAEPAAAGPRRGSRGDPAPGRGQGRGGVSGGGHAEPGGVRGHGHLSEALRDRFEHLVVDYQTAAEEEPIVAAATGCADAALVRAAVRVVRGTRLHPRVRRGASVRGAIAMVELAAAREGAAPPRRASGPSRRPRWPRAWTCARPTPCWTTCSTSSWSWSSSRAPTRTRWRPRCGGAPRKARSGGARRDATWAGGDR